MIKPAPPDEPGVLRQLRLVGTGAGLLVDDSRLLLAPAMRVRQGQRQACPTLSRRASGCGLFRWATTVPAGTATVGGIASNKAFPGRCLCQPPSEARGSCQSSDKWEFFPAQSTSDGGRCSAACAVEVTTKGGGEFPRL